MISRGPSRVPQRADELAEAHAYLAPAPKVDGVHDDALLALEGAGGGTDPALPEASLQYVLSVRAALLPALENALGRTLAA